ncbi:MAG: hypothetical protein CMJ52_03515 [Planctomycetaceae bacterium]|nr:hypothetical protein [Planctomycetaceae bacterium]
MTLRATFILDGARVHHEHAAFARLAVGLAAEGIRTLLALDGDPNLATDDRDAPIPTITVPTRLPFWIRERAIDATLDAFNEAGMDQLDVVVAAGATGIGFAHRLARRIDRPLVVEVRSRNELRAVPRDPGITVVAATEAIRRLAARRLGEDRCTHLPVPVPRTLPLPSGPRNLGVILGPVETVASWTAMIDALAGRERLPGGLEHVAIELGDRRVDGRIWSHLRQRELLSRVTAFDHADRLRALLADAALVLLPESGQSVRSIERQAMYGGAVPIAVEDADRDDLRPATDAVVLPIAESRQPSAWREAIERGRDSGLAQASRAAAVDSLVSRVAPRWARILETIVHGDATPIDRGD